jgi:transmembrane sensor
VYERDDGVLVTVSEGTVKVGSADALLGATPSDSAVATVPESILSAGQQADLHGATTTTRKVSSEELARSVSWRGGTLYFENRPLGEILDELGRYTPLKLVVQDEGLRHLSVGGTFEANPQGVESLLAMLQQGFGVTVRREGDRTYIQSASDRHP